MPFLKKFLINSDRRLLLRIVASRNQFIVIVVIKVYRLIQHASNKT